MNDLIKINNDGLVSARELHEFLEVTERFQQWFDKKVEKYGFIDGEDFVGCKFFHTQAKQELQDYALRIDMAKELSMVQNNSKGRQARKYFIQVEKAWNSPEMIMKRALEIANKQVKNLKFENNQQKQIIGELKPKADYTDLILKNKGLVSITQIAKDYGMSGKALNNKLHDFGIQFKQSEQWLLYSKYHNKGYTHSETIPITHKDGRSDITMTTKWTQKGRLFLYDLLKHQGILPMIEQ